MKNNDNNAKNEKGLINKIFDIEGLLKRLLPEKLYVRIEPFMESALFVFWGVITTLIGLIFYHVLVLLNLFGYKYAKIIQMIFSKILSYVCNKFGVFKTTENKKHENVIEIALFIITRAAIMVLDYFLLIFFVQVLGIDRIVANYVEFPIIVAINYITGKLIVYNRKMQIFLGRLFKKSEKDNEIK